MTPERNPRPAGRVLKTKRIRDPRERADGTRILITRYWPRGVKREHFDTWQRELAPSMLLLKDFKYGGISDEEFARRFTIEMRENPESRASIDELRRPGPDTTLLCHEPEGVMCHRHLLYRMITGARESPEYGNQS